MARKQYIDGTNSGYVVKNDATDKYLSGIRAKYESPNYLTPEYYRYVSRYSKIRRIQNNDTGEIFHETYNNYSIPEKDSDTFFTVNNAVENRLDIISMKYYKSPIMWWIIAIANNIIDPFSELPTGTVLRIPELTSVYSTNIL